ncbi:MAG: NmrA/HSCARG family protein [Acidobacteriota bacterium]
MFHPLSVLVTGATGQQGGALARLLLRRGHHVRALTRKIDSPAAREINRLGAEVVAGDLNDLDALEKAMHGMEAAFAVSTPFEAGMDAEVRQGVTAAHAARASGLKHLVYTSVAAADRRTGIPHFESKYKVEQQIVHLGIPHTIIGPVFFMENFISPWFLPDLQKGKLAMALPPARKLAQISLDDIAEFAALALERRQEFLGKRIDIGSDEVSGLESAGILSGASGREISYAEVPLEQVRAWSEDFAIMYEWFDRVGYSIDTAALRRDYPQVGWRTLEQWAAQQSWDILLPQAGG